MRTLYALLLLILASVDATTAQDYEQQPCADKDCPTGVDYQFDDALYREEFLLEGARYRELTGEAAGLPISALPGARFISSAELKRTSKRMESGLFLLDMDYVPVELANQLKREGYRLAESGELFDKDGQPVLMVMRAHVYAIYDEHEERKQSAHWNRMLDFVLPGANAGDPYPLRCATWAWRRTYNGGFCRSIKAETWADAWGPSEDGSCGPDRPHTRIEYIETRAHVTGAEDRDSCGNCDNEYSRDKWNIGCFWPAFGGGDTWHYAHVKDGALRGTATATSR